MVRFLPWMSCLALLAGLSGAQPAERAKYPAEWWAATPRAGKPAREKLPKCAGPGEGYLNGISRGTAKEDGTWRSKVTP